MKITATATVTVERPDGTVSSTVETVTGQVPADTPYTLRQNVRETAATALGRLLDRVEGTDA